MTKINKVIGTGLCSYCEIYASCEFLQFSIIPTGGVEYKKEHKENTGTWKYYVNKCGAFKSKPGVSVSVEELNWYTKGQIFD
jgi:hypothetical protein